jgi:hypothetical protein
VTPTQAPAPEEHDTHRVAFVRGWLAGAAAFVLVFLAVRWVMLQIWPDQGDLSDVTTGLLRAGTSLAAGIAAGLAVGLRTFGRRMP